MIEFEKLESASAAPHTATILGTSREGRPIEGFRFGRGETKISLIGGCHADEPVGPRLLDCFSRYLSNADIDSDILAHYQWWIVPHVNPDGAERNRPWSDTEAPCYDFTAYLQHVVREPPGEDIEFGFPRDAHDDDTRPENRAVYRWWRSDAAPFALHVSLHGMAFAAGPWFLIDPEWAGRSERFIERCRAATESLGYTLHDVQRHGDKGFVRIARGFATRPNSAAMAKHFIDRGDADTAQLFRPSSMETIRSLGGDALTLVSEMPLFIVPGVGERIEPADTAADEWRERIIQWKLHLGRGANIEDEVSRSGLEPMPIRDQMRLQWAMILAGLDQVGSKS